MWRSLRRSWRELFAFHLCLCLCVCVCVFFFNDTATTEIYTLSLHDALPILVPWLWRRPQLYSLRLVEWHFWISTIGIVLYMVSMWFAGITQGLMWRAYDSLGYLQYSFGESVRSEEHTSELQSPVPISYAVFCLKKKKKHTKYFSSKKSNLPHLAPTSPLFYYLQHHNL